MSATLQISGLLKRFCNQQSDSGAGPPCTAISNTELTSEFDTSHERCFLVKTINKVGDTAHRQLELFMGRKIDARHQRLLLFYAMMLPNKRRNHKMRLTSPVGGLDSEPGLHFSPRGEVQDRCSTSSALLLQSENSLTEACTFVFVVFRKKTMNVKHTYRALRTSSRCSGTDTGGLRCEIYLDYIESVLSA